MTRKQTKKKRDALLEKARAAKAEKVEVENYDHLLDPFEKYLLAEKEKEKKE